MSGSITLNVTPEQFVQDFPSFSDTSMYPGHAVNMYLTLATKVLNARRFGDYLPLVTELWAAHFLTLDAKDSEVAAEGGIMGQTGGQISSKSIGGVSVNFDTAAGLEEGAGHWNLTTFGKRFIRLARMAGTGGVQITGATDALGFPLPGTQA